MKYEITPCNVFDATCAINHKRAHVVQREPNNLSIRRQGRHLLRLAQNLTVTLLSSSF